MALQLNFSNSTSMGSTGTIESFIGFLFQARNTVHLHHLATKSYAQHIALGDLYDFLLSIADTLVESAQTDKLITINIPSSKIEGDAISYVKSILDYVRKNRSIFPYSFQQNEIDSLELCLSKTIYKLKFLQ